MGRDGEVAAHGQGRADATVVEADVAYRTDSGLLANAVGKIAGTVKRQRSCAGEVAPVECEQPERGGEQAEAGEPGDHGPVEVGGGYWGDVG